MKIKSGDITQKIGVIALSTVTPDTEVTGLTAFTVVWSKNGSAPATIASPIVTEANAATMPGLYWLTVSEGTTLSDATLDEEELIIYVSGAFKTIRRSISIFKSGTLAVGAVGVGSTVGTIVTTMTMTVNAYRNSFVEVVSAVDTTLVGQIAKIASNTATDIVLVTGDELTGALASGDKVRIF